MMREHEPNKRNNINMITLNHLSEKERQNKVYHQTITKVESIEEAKPIPPPDATFLKGSMLNEHNSSTSALASHILSMTKSSILEKDPLSDNQGTFLSIGDIKDVILKYEFDRFSNGIASILEIYVQHGCNKLRTKLPLYQVDPAIFERYMDQYLPWAQKAYIQRMRIRNAGTERTTHLEYRFKAPFIPPFGNRNWCTKFYSSIFYDYEDNKSTNNCVKREFNEDDMLGDIPGACTEWHHISTADVKEEVSDRDDYTINNDKSHGIDWQHVATGVTNATFFVELSTGLVSCNLKLRTMKLMETKGIVYTNDMSEMEEGWIDAL